MRLSDFIGNDAAKLALLLNAVEPRCGGALLLGGRGSGKSTLARLMPSLLEPGVPFVTIPLHADEEALLGGIELESTLASGRRIVQEGLLARLDGGFALIDDLHLLSPEVRALVLEAQGRGELILEREGLSRRCSARFCIVATATPDEVELPAGLLDRFGLCAVMEGPDDAGRRLEVLRLARDGWFGEAEPDLALAAQIGSARKLLPKVKVPAAIEDRAVLLAQSSHAAGHRAELFLWHACRALAALEGVKEVSEGHLERVAPLVLAHRRRELAEPPDDGHAEQEAGSAGDPDQEQSGKESSEPPPSKGEGNTTEDHQRGLQGDDQRARPQPGRAREEVQEVGRSFAVRRLAFRKDRLKRKATGRRTATKSEGRGGRAVRSTLCPPSRDVALDATLRACAPFQAARGRKDRLLIEIDDFRYRQRERKMGHLVLFIVDGSGSMGARRRMTETKGAVSSLLADCYEKRDKVAMIVFRKDRAETVLPPTSSVVLASRRLAVLPVGGRTPLSAGLLEAHRLIRRVRLKEPRTRILVVLITDGRANQAVGALTPLEEASRAARMIAAEPGCDFLVVDTEGERDLLRVGLARNLAQALGAECHTVESLRAERLTALARERLEERA
ncbi:MAG TPA: VWA domain-containing protein [Anaeromyxobacteraceae bacterium]|nr:VWA domain-containing protein [Anaeromyxobacteraceae bacterium]